MLQFIDLKKQYEHMAPEILSRIKAVLDHGQYIMGPEVNELEERLAEYVGVKHAVLCSSGTDALLMALMALDIKPGDEIITSPFSFFATAEVILFCGAKPVFVDIDAKTYNLDPNKLEQAITSKTKAIMPVSLYGQCAEFNAINEIAARYALPVIEDAAQSFGATYHGQRSGALSTIACTSFFPSKPLGAYGDAGGCFTNDDTLATALREIRIHGQAGRYEHVRLGINGRIDTIQAAILLEKVKHFDAELAQRQSIAAGYSARLESVVRTPYIAPAHTSAFAQYTIEVDSRDAFEAYMKSKGIPTAVHYPSCMHLQAPLQHLGLKAHDFPIAERASQRVISLPMHPYLSTQDLDYIAEQVSAFMHIPEAVAL